MLCWRSAISSASAAVSECADTYGKAIATIRTPERPHWAIFFSRGICYERAKQWDKAEADLKKALELYPDQPQVLNYLGYSWMISASTSMRACA